MAVAAPAGGGPPPITSKTPRKPPFFTAETKNVPGWGFSVGSPKEHGAQTRAALLAAAAELLHEEGPGAVSVRRVAAAVGTSTRAVYSLFHDKEGLLRELSVDVAETMRRHHESVPVSDDPATEILELTLAY